LFVAGANNNAIAAYRVYDSYIIRHTSLPRTPPVEFGSSGTGVKRSFTKTHAGSTQSTYERLQEEEEEREDVVFKRP
jgi:hypothetical protein